MAALVVLQQQQQALQVAVSVLVLLVGLFPQRLASCLAVDCCRLAAATLVYSARRRAQIGHSRHQHTAGLQEQQLPATTARRRCNHVVL